MSFDLFPKGDGCRRHKRKEVLIEDEDTGLATPRMQGTYSMIITFATFYVNSLFYANYLRFSLLAVIYKTIIMP